MELGCSGAEAICRNPSDAAVGTIYAPSQTCLAAPPERAKSLRLSHLLFIKRTNGENVESREPQCRNISLLSFKQGRSLTEGGCKEGITE
jgi:hypothetical protein